MSVTHCSLPVGRMLMPSGMHDAVIPIFDNEPTSVISYFLYTRSYQQALNDRMKTVLAEVRRPCNIAYSVQQLGGFPKGFYVMIYVDNDLSLRTARDLFALVCQDAFSSCLVTQYLHLASVFWNVLHAGC